MRQLAIGVVCGELGVVPTDTAAIETFSLSPSAKCTSKEFVLLIHAPENFTLNLILNSIQTKLIGLQLASKLYSLSFHDPGTAGRHTISRANHPRLLATCDWADRVKRSPPAKQHCGRGRGQTDCLSDRIIVNTNIIPLSTLNVRRHHMHRKDNMRW